MIDVYYLAYGVMIEGHKLLVDLILLDMVDFNAILSMD